MSKLMKRSCRPAALVAAMALLGAVPASAGSAGEIYRWTSADGTVAFADDLKRIPERYRAGAKRETVRSLPGYARFTPSDSKAEARHAEALTARLERLRALNGTHPQATTDTRGVDPAIGNFQLRNPGVKSGGAPVPSVQFAADPDDPTPVVIEKERLYDPSRGSTRHVTVIRQGERVLGVIKPPRTQGPVAWGYEDDLF